MARSSSGSFTSRTRSPTQIQAAPSASRRATSGPEGSQPGTDLRSALALIEKPVKDNWTLFYSRGVCNERMKDWPNQDDRTTTSPHGDRP